MPNDQYFKKLSILNGFYFSLTIREVGGHRYLQYFRVRLSVYGTRVRDDDCSNIVSRHCEFVMCVCIMMRNVHGSRLATLVASCRSISCMQCTSLNAVRE